MSIHVILLVCALVAKASSSGYRLPNSTIPKHYELKLWTNAYEGKLSYRGLVEILVEVVEPTSEVILHAGKLTITECRIFQIKGKDDRVELRGLKVENLIENEQLKISSNKLLNDGIHSLRIQFNGTVNAIRPEGLFLVTYRDENDTERFVMASQFEPTQARQAFPCFDEPALKATFNVSVVHNKNHEAYSNMPVMKRKVVEGNFVESSFQQTPMMSTYLLVICTTDLEVKTVGNQFAIIRSSLMGKAEDSMRISQEMLNFMNKYTNLDYSDYMPTLGHLAVPFENFAAMENWGLIVYTENDFIDNQAYYQRSRFSSIGTIAHEVVHQWFGNLVTPQWWSNLWLKEGFTTFYQYYALDQIRPNERWMDLFLIDRIPGGLIDSKSARPISFECNDSMNISLQYGPSSYEKSAGILNMFRYVLGDEKWQKAMQIYLKSRLLNSSTPDDLYSAIEAVSEEGEIFPPTQSVKEIFDSWISQEGTVLVTVERLEGSNKIIVHQSREEPCVSSGLETRIIPFNYAYESFPNFEETGPIHWLTSKAAQINTNASYDDWIIFNKDRFGMYKINYDSHNWRLIIRALHKNVSCIPNLNRAQLLDDALDCYKNQRLHVNILFELVSYLRNETDLLVWSRGRKIINFLLNMVIGIENFKLFKIFQSHLIQPIYETLQTTQSKFIPFTEPIRRWITNMACIGGIQHCLQTAQHAFSSAVETNSTVRPEELYTVYCFGMKNSTNDEFNWLLSRFRTTEDSREQDLLLLVLLYCTDGLNRTRTALLTIRDYLIEDKHRYYVLIRVIMRAEYKIEDEKVQQLFEILVGDSEFVVNLGTTFRGFLLRLVIGIMIDDISQMNLLAERFEEHRLVLEIFDEKPDYNSLVMANFLRNYVSKLVN